MNLSLPPLPFWQARSFYAQLLLAASVLLNTLGVDLMGFLAATGFGATPDEVVARGVSIWQALAPLGFGLWAWFERRAPNYRLVIGAGHTTGLRMLGGLFIIGVLASAVPALAAQDCAPGDRALRLLDEKYGETLQATAIAGRGFLQRDQGHGTAPRLQGLCGRVRPDRGTARLVL